MTNSDGSKNRIIGTKVLGLTRNESGPGLFSGTLFLMFSSVMVWLFGTLVNRIAFRFNDGPVKSLIFHGFLIACSLPVLVFRISGRFLFFPDWFFVAAILIVLELREICIRSSCFTGHGYSVSAEEFYHYFSGTEDFTRNQPLNQPMIPSLKASEIQGRFHRHPAWLLRGPDPFSSWSNGGLITTTDLAVTFHRIPQAWLFGEFRAVFVSDLHMGRQETPDDYFMLVSRIISSLKPHFIFLGGDFVHKSRGCEILTEFLQSLKVPGGIYAILGNHDYSQAREEVLDAVMGCGIIYIGARAMEMNSPDGRKFILSGHEEPWGPAADFSGYPFSEDFAVESINRPGWMCISHTADNFGVLSSMGADLVLSGHYHGGQIRFPFFGTTLVPSFLGRRFASGSFESNGSTLIVTRGVGVSGPPLRVMCNPEITVLDFV
ncbi:MAG: hypothetical protein CVV64_10580 [Candidatus Wallbacteria bacterium HGW-Wallbacteria-1]|jgi:hypothetical protein|uniref:Calcineurin-like phosphoesterase domain-containing protein n=1 Tax=Candidatus Wallbacteria bacterium HGW-Wallbacteria-1 TaxID=2013854 RepID=A0A2N1PP92_9BACT|nr:MAG: hypothetical protein CVV64_10580 [Candidatus Wallbacteria bacterium HGW-Wallbacteria-1]